MIPLTPCFTKLPLTHIKPKGWLLNQLIVQAKGLSGNVHKLFRDLSEKSAWLGGKGESWERGPYYLDGLIPLAYLTDDENIKSLAKKWLEAIFSSQTEDGFFGPKGNLDWWPRMVVTKAMPSYFEASQDERVIPFLTKYYRYMLQNIDARPFYSWANARGNEELIGVLWLYNKTSEPFLIDLINKIVKYSMPWQTLFENFPYTNPSKDYIPPYSFNVKKVLFYATDFINNMLGSLAPKRSLQKINARNNDDFNKFYHLTHGVNLAMAIKYPAIISLASGNNYFDISKKAYETLLKHHGTATGLFTCDEHLSGPSPTQGIELCTVVETMFSMEKLIEYTGDLYYADILELLCFNALPATFTYDMCAHQYVQQVNQISATTAKRKWYDSYSRANIYGLKPNYACCLSNMHQGFPRFAEHIAFVKDDALVISSPVACEISTKINGDDVFLEISGDYPFINNFAINANMGSHSLLLRCPNSANYIIINGEKHINTLVEIPNANGTYEVEYSVDIRPKTNPDETVSYYYGNILLALKLEEKIIMHKNNVFADREMFPLSNWNLAPIFKGNEKIYPTTWDADYPFKEPPFKAKFNFVEITNWTASSNQANVPPKKCELGKIFVNYLVPYGATNLRIAQFPKL